MSSTTVITTGSVASSLSSASSLSTLTVLPRTTTSTIDYLTSTSVLPSTQSSLPPAIPDHECNLGVLELPTAFPACGLTSRSNVTVSVFRSCCNGAPIVSYNYACGMYCEGRNQTLQLLGRCISEGFRRANVTVQGPLCNRAGESYNSLLPANTDDPATRSTPTSTRNSGAATSTGAAAKLAVRPLGEGVSAGAWATVALMVVG